MTERVLAAIDLSEASDAALRAADEYCAGTGARLAVCHVLPDLVGLNPLFPQHYQTSIVESTALQQRVRRALEERLAKLAHSKDAELYIDVGVDYAQIVRRAEELGAELVVVGSHGRTGLERVFMGSVAERVVRYAHTSVLVVRNPERTGPVLVATDLSEPSLPALPAGAKEAERRGQRLVVMHALDFGTAALTSTFASPFGGIGAFPPPEAMQSMLDAAGALLRDALARLNVTGETRVVEGAAARAIVDMAEELGAGLVVVGTRGRTGVARLALGSVAERVIASAPCSVLAVRMPAG